MKYEEVMEAKKGFKTESVNVRKQTMTITVSTDWIETVSDAVDKQIAVKPIPDGKCQYSGKTIYKCPVCGDDWNCNEFEMKFCWECGQKLDWSDDND